MFLCSVRMCKFCLSVPEIGSAVQLLVPIICLCRKVVHDTAGVALASGCASGGGERRPQGCLVLVRLPGQPR